MVRTIKIFFSAFLITFCAAQSQERFVSVRTIPGNATVSIDSISYGVTPIDSILLPLGQHHMIVRLNEYREKDFLFDVTGEADRNFVIYLTPTFGFFSLTVSPPGSLIAVNGGEPIAGPLVNSKITAGDLFVSVTHPDFRHSITGTLTVGPGTLVTSAAELDRFSLTAFEFSLLAPGLGQMMDDAIPKGAAEMLATAAAGYFIYFARSEVVKKEQTFIGAKQLYDEAAYESIIAERKAAMRTAADDLERMKTIRAVSYATLGAVYLLTLADALIFHSLTKTLSIESGIVLPVKNDRFQFPPAEIRLQVPIR